MIRGALLLVLAGMLAVGCGDDGSDGGFGHPVTDAGADGDLTPDAMPREVIQQERLLEPGESVEGIMTGGAEGDKALILLSAPSAHIGWNIHTHPNGTTVEAISEYDKMNVAFVFDPPQVADWFMLVRNDDNTAMSIDVEVQLHGNFQWEWQ